MYNPRQTSPKWQGKARTVKRIQGLRMLVPDLGVEIVVFLAQFQKLSLGRELMDRTLNFCRDAGYQRVFLWTAGSLKTSGACIRGRGSR